MGKLVKSPDLGSGVLGVQISSGGLCDSNNIVYLCYMKEQILQLRQEGKSYSEIKAITGCSKGTIAYHLGEGQKDKYKAANARRRARNRRWVEEIKKDLRCEICGESRHWVLDFHHKDPSVKEAGIAVLLGRGTIGKITEEMAKCQVLCSNCHRDLHYREKKWSLRLTGKAVELKTQ